METLWKSDLPERVGPMVCKELRQQLRRSSFTMPFLLLHAAGVGAAALELFVVESASASWGGVWSLFMFTFAGPVWVLIASICVLVLPLGGLLLMGQEMRDGNQELLLLTPLTRRQVVWGKFLALWGLCLLTLISMSPYVVLRFFAGGVEWGGELGRMLTVASLSSMVCAFSIAASSYPGVVMRLFVMTVLPLALAVSALFAYGSGMMIYSARGTSGPGGGWAIWAASSGMLLAACVTLIALAIARARLKTAIHAYEVSASRPMFAMVLMSPFIVGTISVIGVTGIPFVGMLAYLGLTALILVMDREHSLPVWMRTAIEAPGEDSGGVSSSPNEVRPEP